MLLTYYAREGRAIENRLEALNNNQQDPINRLNSEAVKRDDSNAEGLNSNEDGTSIIDEIAESFRVYNEIVQSEISNGGSTAESYIAKRQALREHRDNLQYALDLIGAPATCLSIDDTFGTSELVNDLVARGVSRDDAKEIARVASKGAHGVYARASKRIFIFANRISSIDELMISFNHERQHRLNSMERDAFINHKDGDEIIKGNLFKTIEACLTIDSMLDIIEAFDGDRNFYADQINGMDSMDAMYCLADEILAFGMSQQYEGQSVWALLKKAGIRNDKIVRLLNDINNEQRNNKGLSKFRRGSRNDNYFKGASRKNDSTQERSSGTEGERMGADENSGGAAERGGSRLSDGRGEEAREDEGAGKDSSSADDQYDSGRSEGNASGEEGGERANNPTVSAESRERGLEEAAPAENPIPQMMEEYGKSLLDKFKPSIDKWSKLLGKNFDVYTSLEQVENPIHRQQILEQMRKGERVRGFYSVANDHAVALLFNIADANEFDQVMLHEVVSHKGLRGLLGDKADAFLKTVYDDMMSTFERAHYLQYIGANPEAITDKNKIAAADEFIAHIAEGENIDENVSTWDKIVTWIKEKLGLELDAKDIQVILRRSLKNFADLNAKADAIAEGTDLEHDTAVELAERGLTVKGGAVMSEEAAKLKEESGYKTPNEMSEPELMLSHTTIDPWKRNYVTIPGSKKMVVKAIEALDQRMMANELISEVVPTGEYRKTKASMGPLRSNVEYVVTFDMDTSCPRTFAYLAISKQVERRIGRPLTQKECVQLIESMRAYGTQIPCVYCYAENKRQAMKQYYINFMDARKAVLSAATDEEALKHMYGHETTEEARFSNDPDVALTEAAAKVFKEWRANRRSLYNPDMKRLWMDFSHARNSAITILDELYAAGKIDPNGTDNSISKALAAELKVTNKQAIKALESDVIAEWRCDTIEGRAHDGYEMVDDDDIYANENALSVWRDMTAYAKSASGAKLMERYLPYTDELKKLSKEQRDYINGMGGVRMHSSNDFRIDYVMDYFQFMADMAANKMLGHTYTKEPKFVRIFGDSGYKINMSIAAYEEDGNVRENVAEGFSWADAQELRKLFPNAGVMLMATSDNQIQMALDSDWIDMFIPFHHSGLPKAIWYNMRAWQDYTTKQNEKFYTDKEMKAALTEKGIDVSAIAKEDLLDVYAKEFGIKVLRNKKGERIKPHFLPGNTKKDGADIPGHGNDVQKYLDLCKEYGVHPRFEGVEVTLPDGTRGDITRHPGYIKCIKETARTDSPQTPIQFNFDQPSEKLGGISPMDYAMKELEALAMAEAQMAGKVVNDIYTSARKDTHGVAEDFIKNVAGKDLPLDYLSPAALDYFKNTRKAIDQLQGDVDHVPYHRNEYDENGLMMSKVYHGSGADFTKFDHSFMSTGEGNQAYGWGTYVTTNRDTAEKYALIASSDDTGNMKPGNTKLDIISTQIRSIIDRDPLKDFNDAKQELLEDYVDSRYTKEDLEAFTEEQYNSGEYGARRLYSVEIPDDNGENYLHWDKPLTRQQVKKIHDGLMQNLDAKEMWGDDKELDHEIKAALGYGVEGRQVEGGLNYILGNWMDYSTGIDKGAERNSKFLSSLGFIGMQVAVDRNGGGRYQGDNYVIYNTDDAQITDKIRFSKKSLGTPYYQFKGDAKAAVEFLKEKKEGQAIAALYHSSVGYIDLVMIKK